MIITHQDDLERFCAGLRAHPFITIDTEFLREKTYYPKLCLIQVSDPNLNAAAIDPIDGTLDLKPLLDILLDRSILKIFHAGRQDLEILYRLTEGKMIGPFFDTQIAAMVCGYGDSVGYENLVRNITGESLDKAVQFTDWSKRPLSKRQLDYALGDVTHLVKIFEKMKSDLDRRGRTSWVFEEEGVLSNPETYENRPEDAWKRIKLRSPKPKTLAVLRALADWREKMAQNRDLPRTWIMRDETRADMASQSPTTLEQLKKIRNIPADLSKNNLGQTLLDIMQKALESDKATWPKPEQKKVIPGNVQATIEVLKLLLKVQAAEHDVAMKLIACSEDIEKIAMEKNPDVPAMKGWRFEIFGREAMALKDGKIAVGLRGSKIHKFIVAEFPQDA